MSRFCDILACYFNTGNQFSPTTIAAAITSRDEKHQLPTHIWIGRQFHGLHKDSMILLEQVRTLDLRRLHEYIGCLDKKTLQAVDKGLTVSLGIKQVQREEKCEANKSMPCLRYQTAVLILVRIYWRKRFSSC